MEVEVESVVLIFVYIFVLVVFGFIMPLFDTFDNVFGHFKLFGELNIGVLQLVDCSFVTVVVFAGDFYEEVDIVDVKCRHLLCKVLSRTKRINGLNVRPMLIMLFLLLHLPFNFFLPR